ncbi:MAG: AAA family ATPase, partial [Deltaproteobacteria bacterium]|nr:AAA family ATPase [Deltaproteobacteria bacterium]
MADNPLTPLELPIGVADFNEFAIENYYYADKTMLLYELVKKRKPYFLSRPRRFGKSLLVSTLANILKGRRELFKGLWIDGSDYDWRPYPVIFLDMNKARTENPALTNDLLFEVVGKVAHLERVEIHGVTPGSRFD